MDSNSLLGRDEVLLAAALDGDNDAWTQLVARFQYPLRRIARRWCPELPADLPPLSRERKLALLQMGISSHYARLCFEAYEYEGIFEGRGKYLFSCSDQMNRLVLSMDQDSPSLITPQLHA